MRVSIWRILRERWQDIGARGSGESRRTSRGGGRCCWVPVTVTAPPLTTAVACATATATVNDVGVDDAARTCSSPRWRSALARRPFASNGAVAVGLAAP